MTRAPLETSTTWPHLLGTQAAAAFRVQQIQSIWFPMITVQNRFGQVTLVLADSMFWRLLPSPTPPYCDISLIMCSSSCYKMFASRICVLYANADLRDGKSSGVSPKFRAPLFLTECLCLIIRRHLTSTVQNMNDLMMFCVAGILSEQRWLAAKPYRGKSTSTVIPRNIG